MKIIHMNNIPKEHIHNNSISRKSLLKIGDVKGDIQTMNFAWLEKNMSLEEHTHEDCVEFFLFLEGIGQMTIGNKEIEIKKGDFVTVEKSEPHSIQEDCLY